MSKTRKPQVLELTSVEVESEAPLFAEPLDEGQSQTVAAPRGFRWLALFGSAFAGLILLGLTLWAENFVSTLLERQPALGWVALGLLVLAALGLLGFIAKETRAIMRLEKLDDLRDSFQKAYDEDDTPAARKALDQVTAIYRSHPNTAHGRDLRAAACRRSGCAGPYCDCRRVADGAA